MSFNFFDDIFGNCPDEIPTATLEHDEEDEEDANAASMASLSNQPPASTEPLRWQKPRKRANYFSDLVEYDLSKASNSSLRGRTVRCFPMKMMAACIGPFPA